MQPDEIVLYFLEFLQQNEGKKRNYSEWVVNEGLANKGGGGQFIRGIQDKGYIDLESGSGLYYVTLKGEKFLNRYGLG